MAKKKDLKSSINYICDQLMSQCIAITLGNLNISEEKTENILNNIIQVRSDYVGRISHQEPGLPPKAYYKDIIESFNKQISDILDQINNL